MAPSIEHVFAGLPVSDLADSRAWYERLLGRPPDLVPNDSEVAWQLAGSGWIYVVAGTGSAGGALLTLLVSDLDALVAEVEGRGLAGERSEAGVGRKALFTDPDGNRVTFAQPT